MILREVAERSTGDAPKPPSPPKASTSKGGFPSAKRRPPKFPIGPTSPSSSVGNSNQSHNEGPVDRSNGLSFSSTSAFKSRLSQATSDRDVGGGGRKDSTLPVEVEAENEAQVESMTESQRHEELEELETRFGKSALDALKRRAAARLARNGDEIRMADIPADPHPRSEQAARYSNAAPGSDVTFDQAEPSKLAWTLPVPYSTASKVRFDLQGNALSSAQQHDLPVSNGLHHHGDSPDLAGYTLDEVLLLCRSSVPMQRISMLHLLAKIIGRHYVSPTSTPNLAADGMKPVREQGIALSVDVIMRSDSSVGLLNAAIELFFESLGGGNWTWLDKPDDVSPASIDDFEALFHSVSLSWTDLVEPLSKILRLDLLQPTSLYHLVTILRRATYDPDASDAILPLLPIIVRKLVLSKPWPVQATNTPSLQALRFMRDVTSSSRGGATFVMRENLAEPLMRYLMPSLWTGDEALGIDLAVESLLIFASLGRYGLASELAITIIDVFRSLIAYVHDKTTATSVSPLYIALATVLLDCLTIWITCAIDPHRTTPEHALTWAQIEHIGWEDDAAEMIPTAFQRGDHPVLASALQCVLSWIEGCKVNRPQSLMNKVQKMHEKLSLVDWDAFVTAALHSEETSQMIVVATVSKLDSRVNNAGIGSLLSPSTHVLMVSTLEQSITAYLVTRPAVAARFSITTSARARKLLDNQSLLRTLFDLFPHFQQGQESMALELLDTLLSIRLPTILPSQDLELNPASPVDLQILRPLLQYAILPDASHVVAPRPPDYMYLKASTTLRPGSSLKGIKDLGLPLRSDWIFTPLSELLRSADSVALAQIPPDWQPSEVELVRATLAMASGQIQSGPSNLTRSEILFNLMKIFMLEHEQHSSSNTVEVFRDTIVNSQIKQMLDTISGPSDKSSLLPLNQSPISTSDSIMNDDPDPQQQGPLDLASASFLHPETFYQYYSDFLTLYEAVSFSDPNFTRLLIPPLAMSYPSDYRKLFWVDHHIMLKSIRTRIADVPIESSDGVTAFFEPAEKDEDVLMGYIRALSLGWVTRDRNELLWRVASHHLIRMSFAVTSGDQHRKEAEDGADKGSPLVLEDKLLKSVMQTVPPPTLKILLWLELDGMGKESKVSQEEVDRRLKRVEDVMGSSISSKLRNLVQ